jgi:hypothetical protein
MNTTLAKLMQFIDQVAVLAADACQVNFSIEGICFVIHRI